MAINKKHLELRKETIRNLDLDGVVGGAGGTGWLPSRMPPCGFPDPPPGPFPPGPIPWPSPPIPLPPRPTGFACGMPQPRQTIGGRACGL